MEKKTLIAAFTIALFFLADYGWPLIGYSGGQEGLLYVAVKLLNRSFWYILLPIAALALLYRGSPQPGNMLGLQKGAREGLQMAFLSTLPMLLGLGGLANFNATWQWEPFILSVALAAFSEEILYRGFLFGQLHRQAGWPFALAAGFGAVVFGLGHLYQGHGFWDTFGIFAVTFAGGLWFAWLYKAWGYNLWVPIGLHFLMNFYWMVFESGTNALGGVWPNVFRAATIAITVIWTVRRQKAAPQLQPAA